MKFSFTKNPESEFSDKESKSNKKVLTGGRGGDGGVARVSDFFFQKNPSLKKKLFSFLGGEGKGGLASESELFYKESKSKKIIYIFLFIFLFYLCVCVGGGGGGGGGGVVRRGGGGAE